MAERDGSDERRREGDQQPGKGSAQQQPSRGIFGIVLVVLLVILAMMLINSPGAGRRVTIAEFRNLYESGEIDPDSVVLRPTSVTAHQKAGADGEASLVVVEFNDANKDVVSREVHEITGGRYESRAPSQWMPFILTFGPLILIIGLLWFLIARGMRNAAAGGGMLGNFGKSRHKTFTKEMTGVTFADVAGIDEAKEEVAEIIEFLKSPKRFTRLGGRIPRGVLLTGPPGCGKTLLAKAIAGEADVPFFSISGSDFVEMFVGVGASRVRDLFKQAKESAPSIIFLDEIDAVGRRRGSGFSTGGHDEREQTLNAILVEMDGFSPADGVIVVAATNRPDVLDPALIRPGRFDRQISVPPPDVKGRLQILQVHAKKVKLGPDVDLEKLAKMTPGFSGADLAAIINEAAISATLQNKDFIEQEDLEEARDKVRFGRAKKSRVREEEENRLTAYHEAGHAVLQVLLEDADPLHKVTIISRGEAGGATFSLPEKDRMTISRRWVRATMRVLCGGRIAEERAMQDASSGAAMDIAQVTNLARVMVLEWGMSEKLGFVRYAGEDGREVFIPEREYSEETARLIDEEIRRFVDEAYEDAKRLLDEHWDAVERVAQALVKYETLSAEEVQRLVRGEALHKPSVSDLLEKARRQTQRKTEAPGGDKDRLTPRSGDEVEGEGDLPPGLASPA